MCCKVLVELLTHLYSTTTMRNVKDNEVYTCICFKTAAPYYMYTSLFLAVTKHQTSKSWRRRHRVKRHVLRLPISIAHPYPIPSQSYLNAIQPSPMKVGGRLGFCKEEKK